MLQFAYLLNLPQPLPIPSLPSTLDMSGGDCVWRKGDKNWQETAAHSKC
jgi:hypothetical protein